MDKSVSWSVAKRHWPRFIFAWVWPLVVYAVMIFLSVRGRDANRFLLSCTVALLITFIVFAYIASLPYWRGQIRLGHALLWLVVISLIVLVLLSLLPFRFPITLTNPTSSTIGSSDSRVAASLGHVDLLKAAALGGRQRVDSGPATGNSRPTAVTDGTEMLVLKRPFGT